eukprot:Gb_28686 [translate_table: standard]
MGSSLLLHGQESIVLLEDFLQKNFQEVALEEECVVQPVPLENDHWGEPISEISNEHDTNEEPTDLQRYDPDSADNIRDGDAFNKEKYHRLLILLIAWSKPPYACQSWAQQQD